MNRRKRLLDPALADAIRGDLEEERRRRAQQSSPATARLWVWRAWLGILFTAIWHRVADAAEGGRRSGWFGPAHEWRQAARGLRRTPWYAASGVGVIALSLTLTTTVFAVVDGVVFRPLPYAKPDRLAFVHGGFRARMGGAVVLVSGPDVRAWRAAAPAAEFATASSLGSQRPVAEADALRDADIDADFLHVIGVAPLIGGFAPADFTGPPDARVVPALLSYETWQARFGGDPFVIGQIRTDNSGQGIRVVGVLPASFVFPTPFGSNPEILTPQRPRRSEDNPTSRSFQVIVRLPDGMTVDALAARLSATTGVVARTFPPLPDDPRISPIGRVVRGPFDVVLAQPLAEALTTQTRPVAVAVFAAAAGLMLLASLNLIGLSASRFLDRRPELGLRRALGGTTMALVRLVAIAIAVTLVVVTIGIAIAMPRRLIQGTGRSTESARGAGRSVVISVQVALALVMTVSGSLLAASLIRIWTEPIGWRTGSAARVRVRSPQVLDLAALDGFLARVRRMPGVADVGALDLPILEGGIYGSLFDEPIGAQKADGDVQSLSVTDGFFGAAGLSLLSGRLPTREEVTEGAGVAVISRQLAEHDFPGRPAIGQTLRRHRDGRLFTVVGVVPDARTVEWDLDAAGEIYVPLATSPRPAVTNIVIRFQRGHDDVIGDVIAAAIANTAGLRVLRADTLASALGESIDWRRFQTWLFVTLGAAALAIVGVGILGLMAMRTGRRTREVGVRMALGATRAGVRRQLVREQATPVAAGLAIGSVAAIWASTVLRSYLYKPPAYDWSAWTAAVVLILAAALTGISIPAWKASRIEPVTALRQD